MKTLALLQLLLLPLAGLVDVVNASETGTRVQCEHVVRETSAAEAAEARRSMERSESAQVDSEESNESAPGGR